MAWMAALTLRVMRGPGGRGGLVRAGGAAAGVSAGRLEMVGGADMRAPVEGLVDWTVGARVGRAAGGIVSFFSSSATHSAESGGLLRFLAAESVHEMLDADEGYLTDVKDIC